jgi:hypothetical protein
MSRCACKLLRDVQQDRGMKLRGVVARTDDSAAFAPGTLERFAHAAGATAAEGWLSWAELASVRLLGQPQPCTSCHT